MSEEFGSPSAVAAASDPSVERGAGAGTAPAIGRGPVPPPDLVLHVDALPDGAYAVSASDGAGAELLPPERADALSRPGGAHPILQQFRTVTLRPQREWEGAIDDLGEQLWDLLPPGLQALYWREMHGTGASVLVCSEEPSMPWELVKPRPSPTGETAVSLKFNST